MTTAWIVGGLLALVAILSLTGMIRVRVSKPPMVHRVCPHCRGDWMDQHDARRDHLREE